MKSSSSQKILVYLLSIKRTLVILIIVGVLVAIPVTLTLNQQSQDLQQEASFEPTATPVVFIPPPPIQTDVNQDGVTNNIDYGLVLTCIQNPQACTIAIVDYNGDGLTTVEDYQILLNNMTPQ